MRFSFVSFLLVSATTLFCGFALSQENPLTAPQGDAQTFANYAPWLDPALDLRDYHIHLRGGMTAEMALERTKLTGVKSGVLENVGREWPLNTNEKLDAFVKVVEDVNATLPEKDRLKIGIQVNDRDWYEKIDPKIYARLDFVLADTMIMGKRPDGSDERLWQLPKDYDVDQDEWFERYFQHCMTVVSEPIDILANVTYLPEFIADRYGKSAVPAILYATRSSRSHERGFYNVTGVPYKELLIDWYRHYYVIYKKDVKRTRPDGKGILKRPKKRRSYEQFRLSPDGKNYAFVTNEAGKVIVWLKEEAWKKPKRIFSRFQKTEDNPDHTFPLLAWHPSQKILGFTLEDAGRCYYYPFNIDEMKREKRQLVDVEKITDFSFSDDGKLILFSGFQNGQSDIFVYSLRARSFQNLTNDFYDDYAPRFINGDKQIVFSSNRPDNQLHPKEHF